MLAIPVLAYFPPQPEWSCAFCRQEGHGDIKKHRCIHYDFVSSTTNDDQGDQYPPRDGMRILAATIARTTNACLGALVRAVAGAGEAIAEAGAVAGEALAGAIAGAGEAVAAFGVRFRWEAMEPLAALLAWPADRAAEPLLAADDNMRDALLDALVRIERGGRRLRVQQVVAREVDPAMEPFLFEGLRLRRRWRMPGHFVGGEAALHAVRAQAIQIQTELGLNNNVKPGHESCSHGGCQTGAYNPDIQDILVARGLLQRRELPLAPPAHPAPPAIRTVLEQFAALPWERREREREREKEEATERSGFLKWAKLFLMWLWAAIIFHLHLGRLFKSSKGEEGEKCAICLELFQPTSEKTVSMLPCGHCLHTKCLKGLLEIMERRTCPLCNKNF